MLITPFAGRSPPLSETGSHSSCASRVKDMSLTCDPKPLSEVVEATIFLLIEFSLNLISLEITDGVTQQLEAKMGYFKN